MIKNRPNYGNNKFIGKCIYCEATKDLEKEHAIPFGLKGGFILQKASCRDCARITTKFEDSFLRKTNLGMRTVQKTPTRHPKKRPTELPMIFIRGSEKCEEMVPIEDYVPVLILPELGPPGVLDGLEHVGGMESGSFAS